MRTSIWLALGLSGCVTGFNGGISGVCAGDRDGDGLCDNEDACPDDATNDRDNDGVCGKQDQCAGEDDRIDADEDGVPDGCDPCLGDPGNDADADGVCAADDPCPGDPDDECDMAVFVAVQADVFPDEVSWQIVDHRSSLIDSGDFRGVGAGYFARVEIPATRTSCLTVRDVGQDGGVRGMVFSRQLNRRYAEWDWGSFGSADTFCFDPSEGTSFNPPREADWVDSGVCEVKLALYLGQYAEEVGYELQTESQQVITTEASGSFTQEGLTINRTFTLTDGEYRLVMLDSYGDGWTGGADDAQFTLTFAGGGEIISGFLQDGFSGWEGFYINCP